jgi:hypothetical protein
MTRSSAAFAAVTGSSARAAINPGSMSDDIGMTSPPDS